MYVFCFIFNNKNFQILVHYYYLLLPPSWTVLIAFSFLLLIVAIAILDGSNCFHIYCLAGSITLLLF